MAELESKLSDAQKAAESQELTHRNEMTLAKHEHETEWKTLTADAKQVTAELQNTKEELEVSHSPSYSLEARLMTPLLCSVCLSYSNLRNECSRTARRSCWQ